MRVRLRAAGKTLLPRITATLAHLRIEPQADVDFTICCWDDKETGAGMGWPTPWMAKHTAFCCLRVLTNRRFRTYYMDFANILSCVDTEAAVAYCCYEDAERLLMYEVSGPFRPLFSWMLNRRGMQMVHASAVGTPGGSLLFAGAPGSGKSTLAVLCLQEGLSYQSDDICVLTSDKQPRSLSIYNIAKLREDALPRFRPLHPVLTHFQEEDGEKKAFFYVHGIFPAQVLKEAPVRALILPRVTGEAASRLERAAPIDALRAVIDWTIREIPKSDRLGEKIMLQAIARIPAYRLHVGADEKQTLALIRSLLP